MATFVRVKSVGNASNPQPLPIICQVPLPTPLHNWTCTTSVAVNGHLDVNTRAANGRKAWDFDRWDSAEFSFYHWDCVKSWNSLRLCSVWIALDEEFSLRELWEKRMSVHFIHLSFCLRHSAFKQYTVGLPFYILFQALQSIWIYISLHLIIPSGPDINILTLNSWRLLNTKQELNFKGQKEVFRDANKGWRPTGETICSQMWFKLSILSYIFSIFSLNNDNEHK